MEEVTLITKLSNCSYIFFKEYGNSSFIIYYDKFDGLLYGHYSTYLCSNDLSGIQEAGLDIFIYSDSHGFEDEKSLILYYLRKVYISFRAQSKKNLHHLVDLANELKNSEFSIFSGKHIEHSLERLILNKEYCDAVSGIDISTKGMQKLEQSQKFEEDILNNRNQHVNYNEIEGYVKDELENRARTNDCIQDDDLFYDEENLDMNETM